ncbi:MAG: glycosyltransferase family 4 protein [Acidimicrobiales bacterium]
MRVGLICPYSLAVWGGVQAQVLALGRALRDRGVDTQVLAPCDGTPPEPWVTPLGNSIPYAQNGSLAPLAPDAAAQLRVIAALWDEEFDVLHLHEPLAPGPTMTALFVKPAPLLGTFHAAGHIGSYRWFRPVVSRMASRLDQRVAVSPEAADMAERHLGGAYDVLFNGIEVDRFAGAEPMPDRERAVLFLGRHEPRKGLSVLLEAVRWLPPDVQILVAGSGPETSTLQARYRDDDRIVWLGPLPELDKRRYLRGVGAFCVPSLGGESFGLVLLEGMAAGVPIVASDLPAYEVVTGGGAYATMFPTGDPQALAKALLDALARTPAIEARISSGRKRAEEFSMDRLAELYLARYDRLSA